MYNPIVVIEVTAKKATGKPALLPNSAGIVMMRENRTTKNTAHVGVRCLFRRRQREWPGTAPSRENANTMREAAATQPIPQNNCPTVEMSRTSFARVELSAVSMMGIAPPPPALIAEMCVAAKVIASSTAQPPTAEYAMAVHSPRGAARSASFVSSDKCAEASYPV